VKQNGDNQKKDNEEKEKPRLTLRRRQKDLKLYFQEPSEPQTNKSTGHLEANEQEKEKEPSKRKLIPERRKSLNLTKSISDLVGKVYDVIFFCQLLTL
jgi:hypothetical protein